MKKEEKSKDKISTYKYKGGERKLMMKRKKRFNKMYKRKLKLGIDNKCDRMDDIYTPHLTNLADPNNDGIKVQTSDNFATDSVLLEKSRKSMPLAFEKVTTAQSLLIKENPKGIMRAYEDKYKANNIVIQNVYYENFSQQRKKEVLKKYVYHLAKYGIGYWREYIKKSYRKQHIEKVNQETGETKHDVIWVYDVFDVVAENIHPKDIILDDNCYSVKDVNKPAVDLSIIQYKTKDEFDADYPEDIYPNTQFVYENQPWMMDENDTSNRMSDGKTKIQVIIYENKFENLQEIWANGVPIKSIPLPGDELSVSGDKWVEDLDNYDGIGICQLIELYAPIVDDIVNASIERLRQIVRPNEDWFGDVELADESDDIEYGSGNVRKFNGSPNNIKYSQPPSRSDAEAKEKDEILEEIDRVTMTPRNLAGSDKAKTAYQAAQNREAALQKLSLPLTSVKKTIEDAANLAINLYKIAYSEPIETKITTPDDEDFNEGMAIIDQAKELGIEDDRAVIMKTDEQGNPTEIARRKFRQMELPMKIEAKQQEEGQNKPTAHIVEDDERKFWEMLPNHFDWRGRIEVIGDSFLPVSKTLRDQTDKETIEYLMNVPTRDQNGQPTLTDANGIPYTIDKVKLVKERARMNNNFDPDKFIVPMSQQNGGQGNMEAGGGNPLESETKIKAPEMVNIKRPELSAPKS